MVKLVVPYGTPVDPAAFDRHYAEVHTPLVHKIPKLRQFDAGRVLGTPDGSPAPYFFMAELLFDSPEDLAAGLESAESQATAADAQVFADGGATLMIAEA